MAAFFGIGLIAFEIVDGGADGIAGFFTGANRVDGVADGEQCLERDHNFVVFDVVADQHKDIFLRHKNLPKIKTTKIR